MRSETQACINIQQRCCKSITLISGNKTEQHSKAKLKNKPNSGKNKVEEKKANEEETKEEEKKLEESKDDKESKEESAPPEIVQGTTFAMHVHFKHDFWHLLS